VAEVLQIRPLTAGWRVTESHESKGLLRRENVFRLARKRDLLQSALLVVLEREASAARHRHSRDLRKFTKFVYSKSGVSSDENIC
jgi:hypothetical protein